MIIFPEYFLKEILVHWIENCFTAYNIVLLIYMWTGIDLIDFPHKMHFSFILIIDSRTSTPNTSTQSSAIIGCIFHLHKLII